MAVQVSPVSTLGVTMSAEMQQVLSVLTTKEDKIRAARRQQRIKDGLPADLEGEAAFIEEANILNLAIRELGRTHSNLGQVTLAALWKMYANDYYRMVGECESLVEWADSQVEEDADPYYIRSLAHIVEKIFTWVHARVEAENPVLVPDSNEPITVDYLITKPSLVSKLKESADHFSKLATDAQREELVIAIATQSRSKLSATRNTQIARAIPDDLKIRAIERVDPKTKTTTIIMENLTAPQVELVRKLMGKAIDLHQK